MHHASAHKKEVVRMTFLFGHRYIHVGRACLGRALIVVSMFLFFVAGQAIVMVAVEHARTTGSDTRDASTAAHGLM